ncbi:MAG TPA: hypothetical protein DCX06_02035 [Opitutae bacterium]|nr:hypothetical protein [Opitutae bacterium]
MFKFLKKRKLQAIQEGRLPFYSYPDKHKQTAKKTLASIIPVILASQKPSLIKAKAPDSHNNTVVILKMSKTCLFVTRPELFDRTELSLSSLREGPSKNEFLIHSEDSKGLASDLDNLICSLLSSKVDYQFECFWSSESTGSERHFANTEEQVIGNEAIALLEKKYGLVIPCSLKTFFEDARRKKSTRSSEHLDRVFMTESELISANDRVRNNSPYSEVWDANWLVIGTDGSGNDYFIVTGSNDVRIYELDHEQVLDEQYDPLFSPRFNTILELE